MKVKKALIREVLWLLDAYDQANTNHAVEGLGSRGEILNSAVEDLRKLVDTDEFKHVERHEGKWVISG